MYTCMCVCACVYVLWEGRGRVGECRSVCACVGVGVCEVQEGDVRRKGRPVGR